MSAARVQKLESLLNRVQRNRAVPRAAAAPTTSVRPRVQRPEQHTPLERAVRRSANPRGASTSPPQAAPKSPPKAEAPKAAAPVEPATRKIRSAPPPAVAPVPVVAPPVVTAPAVAPSGPQVVEPMPMPAPSQPVARASGQAKSTASATFGELLMRSLALRPR